MQHVRTAYLFLIKDADNAENVGKISSMIRDYEIDVPLILSLLNKLDANPNASDSDGNTGLHYASFLPFIGVTQELVVEICKKLNKFGALFDSKITNVNRLYYFAFHQLHGE